MVLPRAATFWPHAHFPNYYTIYICIPPIGSPLVSLVSRPSSTTVLALELPTFTVSLAGPQLHLPQSSSLLSSSATAPTVTTPAAQPPIPSTFHHATWQSMQIPAYLLTLLLSTPSHKLHYQSDPLYVTVAPLYRSAPAHTFTVL